MTHDNPRGRATLRTDVIKPVYFFSIVLTALAMALAACHAFELPNKMALPAGEYLDVQNNYRGWAGWGVFEAGALLTILLLAILTYRDERVFRLVLTALVCMLVMWSVFLIFTFPANQQTFNWTALPPNWKQLRGQWEYSHLARAGLGFTALSTLILSLLIYPQAASSEETTVRKSVTVSAPIDHAFFTFTEQLSSWWPRQYTWSGDALKYIRIQPFEDGHCTEIGPNDFQCDWGRVLIWEPPSRIVFTWQINPQRIPEPDPVKASEVEVRFIAENQEMTRVELEHRKFFHHGQGSGEYRELMNSDNGWPYILSCYEKAINEA